MRIRSAHLGPVNITVEGHTTRVDFILEANVFVADIEDSAVADKLLLVSQQIEAGGGDQVYWLDPNQGAVMVQEHEEIPPPAESPVLTETEVTDEAGDGTSPSSAWTRPVERTSSAVAMRRTITKLLPCEEAPLLYKPDLYENHRLPIHIRVSDAAGSNAEERILRQL